MQWNLVKIQLLQFKKLSKGGTRFQKCRFSGGPYTVRFSTHLVVVVGMTLVLPWNRRRESWKPGASVATERPRKPLRLRPRRRRWGRSFSPASAFVSWLGGWHTIVSAVAAIMLHSQKWVGATFLVAVILAESRAIDLTRLYEHHNKRENSFSMGCPPFEPFRCPSDDNCISIQYLCDGAPDCTDGYDEDPKLCTAGNLSNLTNL